jgi:hypothetical protein
MPPALLSLDAFICEKVLAEQDRVLSMIRLVEIFNVVIFPDAPIERQGAAMTLVVIMKFAPGDEPEHAVELFLIRPSGDSVKIGDTVKSKMQSDIPGFPSSFGIVVPLVVAPKQMGTHHFAIKFDGEEIRRVPFLLVERKLDVLPD